VLVAQLARIVEEGCIFAAVEFEQFGEISPIRNGRDLLVAPLFIF
jgi:hypothetical protein